MIKINVPAIDGIPGIMPGTIKVPPSSRFWGRRVRRRNSTVPGDEESFPKRIQHSETQEKDDAL